MWLFGRRKPGKLKGRSDVAVDDGPVAEQVHAFAANDVLRTSPTRRASARSKRRRRSSPLMRDLDKISQSPSADDDARSAAYTADRGLPGRQGLDDITALPQSRRLAQSPHLRPVSQLGSGIPYNFQHDAHSTPQRGRLQRPQSLRKPANDSALFRRKSSKKQKREHAHLREEEIRAMSMPLPQKRPAANPAGMLRRDSKKVKGPLNHRCERPTSDISLPLQDSIHSSMSGSSDPRAFRVSALSMLSPRPTIRCSVGTQHYYAGAGTDTSPTSNKSKTSTARSKRRNSISRERDDYKRTSRIDSLADSLDAGELREILDRDKKRREKKRKQEEEKLRRRLERRAEKQRAAEGSGTPGSSRNDVSGAVGLGIQKEMVAAPMEDVRPSTPQQTQLQTPVATPRADEISNMHTPMESPMEDPVVSDAQAIHFSRGSISGPGHARGTSNVSHLPELLSVRYAAANTPMTSVEHHDPMTSGSLHAVETVDTTTSQKSTDGRRSSEGRRMGYFVAFFRRGKRKSQDGRTTPSEASFSNTSRESMSRQPLPAHLVASTPTPPIQIKRPSNVPRRTMSKFREDLPEFPMSPPDSRMQSPEVASGVAFAGRQPNHQHVDARNSNSSGARTDSPVSPGIVHVGLMSQSLASVDSEGSWLSGKPIKRASNRSHLRSSVGSLSALRRTEGFNASYEDLGVPDDEYFNKINRRTDDSRRPPNSGEMLSDKRQTAESDDEEEEEATAEEELVKNSVGRQPTIIHRQPRVKSTEGLLSFFAAPDSAEMESTEPVEAESPTSDGEIMILQRAKSIDLGKHQRKLSVGSARLLDISKRRSDSSQSKLQQQ